VRGGGDAQMKGVVTRFELRLVAPAVSTATGLGSSLHDPQLRRAGARRGQPVHAAQDAGVTFFDVAPHYGDLVFASRASDYVHGAIVPVDGGSLGR
jgi:aryl-alcohol dehydrogenase-like predicted oxidoreductase